MADEILQLAYQSGIYEIRNLVNGKRYIGSARCFYRRFHVHRHLLRHQLHHCRYLQNAWTKYGEEAFTFRQIIVCAAKNVVLFEQKAIDALKPEYNLAPIAGSCLGLKHSAETRARRSMMNVGNKFSLGRPASEQCKQAVAKSNRRRKGTKRSPQAIAATAAAHKGMKRSAATRAKIAAKAVGRKWSPEAKAKLSATLTGRKMSSEFSAKLIGNKRAAGRKPTSEENKRRSDSVRAAWAAKKAMGIPWR